MNTKQKLDTLKRSDLFSKVPNSDLRALAESLRIERFKAGEKVCEHGAPADRIYIVASGELDARLPKAKSKVRTMGAGEIIGEYGLFTGQVRSADVTCRKDSVLLSLEYGRFREFLDLFPGTTYALLEQTVHRLLAAQAST
jgi:CRP-like cAMP-binding protein